MTSPNPRLTVSTLLASYTAANADSRVATVQNPATRGIDDLRDTDLISVYEVGRKRPRADLTHDFINRIDQVQVDVMSSYGSENFEATATVTGEAHIQKALDEVTRLLDASRKQPSTLPAGATTYGTLEIVDGPHMLQDETQRIWVATLTVELKTHVEAL